MRNLIKIGGIATALGVVGWAMQRSDSSTQIDAPRRAPTPEIEYTTSFDEDAFIPKSAATPKAALNPKMKRLRRGAKTLKSQRKQKVCRSQVTVANNGTSSRTIRLWGRNNDQSILAIDPTAIEDHTIVQSFGTTLPIFNHPQGSTVHTNGNLYVVNQLSDNVVKLNSEGAVLTTIALGGLIAGSVSPVAIASHPTNNELLVAGSVANTLTVIDTTDQVSATISTGNRPVSVAVHPVNQRIYVVNYGDNSVTVIDPVTHQVEATLSTEDGPMSIAFDALSGDVAVANKGADSVSLFSSSNAFVGTIQNVGSGPISIVHRVQNNRFYISIHDEDKVVELDASNGTITTTFQVGQKPYQLHFHPLNGQLYVANQEDDTFSIINVETSVITTVAASGLNVGWSINPSSGQVFISATGSNSIAVLGFVPPIEVSANYFELHEHFKYNPARLVHIKWVQGNGPLVRNMVVQEQTPTGTLDAFAVSLANYESPQHGLAVSEITECKGWIIDGRHSWEFVLPGQQSATILIYYHRWNRTQLIALNQLRNRNYA